MDRLPSASTRPAIYLAKVSVNCLLAIKFSMPFWAVSGFYIYFYRVA
jgi:hypothetical protein